MELGKLGSDCGSRGAARGGLEGYSSRWKMLPPRRKVKNDFFRILFIFLAP